jgi:hypothetical protein
MKRTVDEFGQRLRTAAEDASPAFSEELHHRAMAGVRRARVGTMAAAPWNWGRLGWVAGGVAVAAVVVMSVGPWAVKPVERPVVTYAVPDVGVSVPELGKAVREAAGPVGEKMKAARFGYLDRDGKRLAVFLWRSVPGVPAESGEASGPS